MAEELGFAVFGEEAELSEKFAFGSSVGVSATAGRRYVIVMSLKDIEHEQAAPFMAMLSRAWHEFSGQAALTDSVQTENAPA